MAVPGELAVYKLAHENHGKLNWSELFVKPIEKARNGVLANAHLVRNINKNKHRMSKKMQ